MKDYDCVVILAKAGIRRNNLGLTSPVQVRGRLWTPAFAGVTTGRVEWEYAEAEDQTGR